MYLSQTLSPKASYSIFYTLHPIHVLLSALVTASMYKINKCGHIKGKCNLWILLMIGYIGSIGIATTSDSLIPYLGEVLLHMPKVNPLAIAGVVIAYFWPKTKFPHAGHVLLSTWTSLFHIMMAKGEVLGAFSYVTIFLFLFLAVWIPCCVSDIVFPLLFVKESN